MNKDKLKAFLAIGVVAVGIAAGMQQVQEYNYVQEQQAVATCVIEVNDTIKDVNSPSFVKKTELNNSTGLFAAARAEAHKDNLKNLNAEKVNCNVKEMREKFLTNLNKVHRANNGLGSSSTPG